MIKSPKLADVAIGAGLALLATLVVNAVKDWALDRTAEPDSYTPAATIEDLCENLISLHNATPEWCRGTRGDLAAAVYLLIALEGDTEGLLAEAALLEAFEQALS